MDLKRIKELIKLVEESEIAELAVEEGDQKVEIKKQSTISAGCQPAAPAVAVAQHAPAEDQKESKANDEHQGLIAIKSPMVGTYYASPSPDAAPYIKVGDHISKGQVVCIVEAMKTFNEIESEVSGKVERILIDNAQSVDFGQPMILVKES